MQQLYQRYQKELYLYLYGLCGSRAAAEDLVQETFLKALLSLPDGHPNFRAWLYLVARNLYFNQQKRDARLTALTDETASEPGELSDRIIADETRAALYQALHRLEPRKREVLLLQYFARLPQREIAAVLGLTPEHIRVLASRGRRELKQWMEEMGYEI